MTIFEILKADHRKVSRLLDQISKTPEKNFEKRDKLFEKFKMEIVTHSKCKEQAVYKVIQEKDKTHDLTMESFEEHILIELLVSQLSDISPSEDRWTAKMSVLTKMIKRHVKEEEGELFRKIKQACNRSELAEMATVMKKLKKNKTFVPPLRKCAKGY